MVTYFVHSRLQIQILKKKKEFRHNCMHCFMVERARFQHPFLYGDIAPGRYFCLFSHTALLKPDLAKCKKKLQQKQQPITTHRV